MKRFQLIGGLALFGAVLLLLVGVVSAAKSPPPPEPLAPVEALGKAIFFDENLSLNRNQSCATCHAPEAGWVGAKNIFNEAGSVYEGSIAGAFGDRKPPSAAYATTSPIFHYDEKAGLWVGGNFWDGRATGNRLGNPAADQAQGPFLNPVEQALSDSACVVYRVCMADYPVDMTEVYPGACNITWPAGTDTACGVEGSVIGLSPGDRATSNMAYDSIALAIAAYEDSREANAYSSKFDAVYDKQAKMTKLEKKGYNIFRGKGKCSLCHLDKGADPLFTDYTFDNLGIPKNPENPVYQGNPDFVDPGLGGFLMNSGYDEEIYEAEWGKHKVPTLRNVALAPDGVVKAYGHNGYFKSLYGIVHFYNTRDILPECPGDYTEAEALAANCWPAPEVMENMNTAELGNLRLTYAEEMALVAFLEMLDDGYLP